MNSTSSPSDYGSTAVTDQLKLLPAGWDMYIDPVTGWPVYVDHNTRSTSWQDPRQSSHQSQTNGGMRVREIPIIRETDQPLHVNKAASSFQRPTSVREIPIQRESSTRHAFGSTQIPLTSTNHSIGIPFAPERKQAHQGAKFGDEINGRTSPSDTSAADEGVQHGSCSPVPADGIRPSVLVEQPLQSEFVKAREIPIVYEPAVQVDQTFGNADDNIPQSCTASSKHQAPNEEPAAESLQAESPAKRGRSPSPSAETLTALELIEQILSEASSLRSDVENFTGRRGEKQYLLLEEMLTRLLIKLDRIDSQGREDVRNARREAVRSVQAALDLLESKTKTDGTAVAPRSESSSQPMDCRATTAEPPTSLDNVDVERESSETASHCMETDETLQDSVKTEGDV